MVEETNEIVNDLTKLMNEKCEIKRDLEDIKILCKTPPKVEPLKFIKVFFQDKLNGNNKVN